MRLKLLLVPSLLILSLILLIGFIKPSYDTWQMKRQELTQKEAEAQKIQDAIRNVESLNAALDQNTDKEQFLLRFYPDYLDQGRLIDSFNFLATQSGVTLTAVSLNEVEQEQQEESLGNVPFTSLQDGTVPAEGDPTMIGASSLISAYQPPKPKLYEAQVTARGDYANLKAFLERVAVMDRLHTQKSYTIGRGEDTGTQAEGEEGEAQSGQLSVTYSGSFEYLPKESGATALQVPIFTQPSFDFSILDEVMAQATAKVPELGVAEGGKANPFQ